MLTDGGSVAVTTLPLLPVFCTIGAEPGAPPLLVMVRSPPVVSPPVSVTTRSLDEPPPPPMSGAAATNVIVELPPPTMSQHVPPARGFHARVNPQPWPSSLLPLPPT